MKDMDFEAEMHSQPFLPVLSVFLFETLKIYGQI